jgi:hypothetical protein
VNIRRQRVLTEKDEVDVVGERDVVHALIG